MDVEVKEIHSYDLFLLQKFNGWKNIFEEIEKESFIRNGRNFCIYSAGLLTKDIEFL